MKIPFRNIYNMLQVFAGTSKAASTQTSGNPGNHSPSSGPDSLRIGEPRRPPFGYMLIY